MSPAKRRVVRPYHQHHCRWCCHRSADSCNKSQHSHRHNSTTIAAVPIETKCSVPGTSQDATARNAVIVPIRPYEDRTRSNKKDNSKSQRERKEGEHRERPPDGVSELKKPTDQSTDRQVGPPPGRPANGKKKKMGELHSANADVAVCIFCFWLLQEQQPLESSTRHVY